MVVFDLDGTLYEQGPVRRAMAVELLAAPGPRGRRVRALRAFRRMREEMAESAPRGFDAALFERFCARTGLSEDEARALVAEWMEARSLRHLAQTLVPGARELFDGLRRNGVRIAVWSDYPVEAKLAALGLSADDHVAATDPELDALKPDPAGLSVLLSRAGLRAGEVLMVGDRTERDGAAARALGAAFLLRAKRGPDGTARVADFTGLAASL